MVEFPVEDDDYIYMTLVTGIGDAMTNAYSLPNLAWANGGGFLPPTDYNVLQAAAWAPDSRYEASNASGFIHVSWDVVPAGQAVRFQWDATSETYDGATHVGKTLIIQGFNVRQCGYVLLPADGSPPPLLSKELKSLMPEDHLKSLFRQWMKEHKHDSSSSSSEDVEGSEEAEALIKRLQDRLAEHKAKKQVTFI